MTAVDAHADLAPVPVPEGLRFRGVQSVPFNFRLGEWRLFSIARRLAVFDWQKERAQGLTLAQLSTNVEGHGYLVRGVPAEMEIAGGVDGWLCQVLRRYPRHFVDLTTGFDDYLGKFSSKTRSTFKRKLRKFQELSGGTTDWREFRTRDEVAAFFPLAREVSSKTYQERLLGTGLPDTEAFRTQALDRADRGAVRAYILSLERRPIAYLYLPVEGARAIYSYMGYDPTLSEHSPGTVLQLLAMERMFADPSLGVFDFTEGEGQHKQLFATHSENCVDIVLLRRGGSNAVLSASHRAFVRSEARLSALLEKLGIRRWLRTALRRLVRSQS